MGISCKRQGSSLSEAQGEPTSLPAAPGTAPQDQRGPPSKSSQTRGPGARGAEPSWASGCVQH